jgi:hypothetical protein
VAEINYEELVLNSFKADDSNEENFMGREDLHNSF